MINLSIKSFFSEINTDRKLTKFLENPFSLYEKIDGTKLTLIRNNIDFDENDYTKNWIVSYKNIIIYPEEFLGLNGKDELIKNESIGTSQYKLIHNHLRNVHCECESIPKNTEFFIEFAQKKITLTRDYKNIGLFLIGIKFDSFYLESNGFVYTQDGEPGCTYFNRESKIFSKYTSILNLFSPRCLLVRQTFSIPNISKFRDFLNRFLQIPSALGGMMEGIIIHSNDKIYKLLQSDQHDKTARLKKKNKFKMDNDQEKAYWNLIYKTSEKIISNLRNNSSLSEKLRVVSQSVYSSDIPIQHEKKTLLNKQDDLFLTMKLQLLNKPPENYKIGILPLSGKPVHDGHWKLINKISDENDCCILLVSIKDRIKKGEFPIYGDNMFEIWRDILYKKLPKNVIFKIVDSPFSSVIKEIDLFENIKKNYYINIYSDVDDIKRFDMNNIRNRFSRLSSNIKLCGVSRNNTVNISGTKMREFLRNNDKNNFISYLPSPLSLKEKSYVYKLLSKE